MKKTSSVIALAVLGASLAGGHALAPPSDGSTWTMSDTQSSTADSYVENGRRYVKVAEVKATGPVSTNAVVQYTNQGLRYFYYYADGTSTISQQPYDVRVGVTTRAWSSCTGCLVEEVDAAASMYRADDIIVGNIQIDLVRLMAGTYPGQMRAETDHAINSKDYGNPLGPHHTPNRCVSPFGSGYYFGLTNVSWRYNTTWLVQRAVTSNYGPATYATITC